MPRMPGVTFRSPASYTSGRPGGPPRFIVIHSTDNSEGPNEAENGANYDANRTDGTSTHFMVDSNSIIQEVDTNNRAHAALYYGNLWGIQIEQCGRSQTRAQWLDPVSRETIRNTAKVCAWIMKTHNIPLVKLTGAQVRNGKGICGHGDITVGFPEDNGSHTDPDGPLKGSYPWDVLFADIKTYLNPPVPEEKIFVSQYVTVPNDVGGPDFLPDGFTATVDWFLSAMYKHILAGEKQSAAAVVATQQVVGALATTNQKLDQLIALLTPPVTPPTGK